MASILYTHGDTHEINGIICKQEFVPAESVHVLLGAGYFASPEDLAASLMSGDDEELEALKARAKELKLKGYGKCDAEALRAKIKEAEEKQEG